MKKSKHTSRSHVGGTSSFWLLRMLLHKPVGVILDFTHNTTDLSIPTANYTGQSGLPWWTLTVLVIISFVFCTLYGMLAATIGFYEFNSSGTGFFQMITGASVFDFHPLAHMHLLNASISLYYTGRDGRKHVWRSLRSTSYDSGNCAPARSQTRPICQISTSRHIYDAAHRYVGPSDTDGTVLTQYI